MADFELYGSRGCPYTQEMRDWLDLKGCDYVEYDVEADARAFERMLSLSGGQRMVPILVTDGAVTQIGWQGRGCIVGPRVAD
jgi:glutaredoxin